jgi:hypothetical protein
MQSDARESEWMLPRLRALVDGAEGAVVVAVVVKHVPQVLIARRHYDPQPPHRPPFRAHNKLCRLVRCGIREDVSDLEEKTGNECTEKEKKPTLCVLVNTYRNVREILISKCFCQLQPK